MRCKNCEAFRADFAKRLKRANRKWEEEDAQDAAFWDGETQENLALIHKAYEVLDDEPEKAIQLFYQAVADGSVGAHRALGWIYSDGDRVEKDLLKAKEHYAIARAGGSWLATLDLARTCYDLGEMDDCLAALEENIQQGHISAHYHYACYKRRTLEPKEKNNREIIRHFEIAAKAGHPNALEWLGRMKLQRKLGIMQVPSGALMIIRLVRSFDSFEPFETAS